MVLIVGKEPGLSVARIIRGELVVINTCVFTAFSRLLIAQDPFELFGSGEGSYTGFKVWVGCGSCAREDASSFPTAGAELGSWLHLCSKLGMAAGGEVGGGQGCSMAKHP